VFAQIAVGIVDIVFTMLVFLLLVRFHFQWLRVPFRNPVGEFVLALTTWAVRPARRVIPGLAGLDLATLLLAWIFQALSLWLQASILGADPNLLALAAVAAVDLARFSIYILIAAIFAIVLFSWINPYAPLAPVFNAFTAPFLRPFRRLLPPVGGVDLTPMLLGIVLYVVLVVLAYLRGAAAGL
jgi:YggT family protein